MNDNELNKLIKDSFEKIEVKTSAEEILNEFNKRKEIKKLRRKNKTYAITFGSLSSILAFSSIIALAVIVPKINERKGKVDDIAFVSVSPQALKSKESQTAISLLGAIPILDSPDLSGVESSLKRLSNNNNNDIDYLTSNIYYLDEEDEDETDDDIEVNDEGEDSDNIDEPNESDDSENEDGDETEVEETEEDESDDDDDDSDDVDNDIEDKPVANFNVDYFEIAVSYFDPNVDLLYSLLGVTSIKNEVSVEKLSEPYKDYTEKMTITLNKGKYIFYTDMPFVSTEHDDDEIETTKEYKGLLHLPNDDEYMTNIVIEKESEEDEGEVEEEITMIINISDDKRIIINQEKETETENKNTEQEKTYKYQVIENNKTIYQQEISYEDEGDKISTCELNIKDSNKGTYNFKQIQRLEDNKKGLSAIIPDNHQFSMEETDKSRIYHSEELDLDKEISK